MHWFYFALASPVLTSFGNFIDKILTERFVSKEASIWVLSLYSSLFSLLVIPIIYFFNREVFAVSFSEAALLILAGMVEIFSVFLYLNALRDEDASTVVPIFQSIPVFGFILGFLILGETLTTGQMLAGLIIILGGVLLTLEYSSERKLHVKLGPLLFMLASSFCFALYDALFKYGALNTSFWTSVFWQHVGIGILGVVLFLGVGKYRRAFIDNIRTNGKNVFGLNFLNETLYVVGVGFYSYALLLAPIAIVATASVYQPVIVFAIGLFFTIFLPHILSETISVRHFFQKISAILIILIGSAYLINVPF